MMRLMVLSACFLGVYSTSCNKLPCEPEVDRLITVFKDDIFQLTGVAISPQGRLFTNYPLWSDVYKEAVAEIGEKDNHKLPYPNLFMNSWKPGANGKDKWVCVQAVYADDENNLWVVDPASPAMEGVY